MAYFRCGGGGAKVYLDGEEYKGKLELETYSEQFFYATNCPITLNSVAPVIWNDCLYLIGGDNGNSDANEIRFYRFNGKRIGTHLCTANIQSFHTCRQNNFIQIFRFKIQFHVFF